MQSPLVSILIPVYNAQQFLKETIDSIIKQTYTNLEIILINDGSTDDSEKIILSYADTRIKYYKNETNLKLIKTLNKGLALCTGKYIARIDADDVALGNRIERQVAFMEANENSLASGCFANFIDATNTQNGVWKFNTNFDKMKLDLLFGSCIIHPTAIFKADVFTKYNITFDENYLHAEDAKFWYDISLVGALANLPEVLLNYRVHEQQITVTKAKQMYETVTRLLCLQLNEANISVNEELKKVLNDVIVFDYKMTSIHFNEICNLFVKYINWNKQASRHNQVLLTQTLSLKLFEIAFYSSNAFNFIFLKQLITQSEIKISLIKYRRLLTKIITTK
jgi:glycosyltransferase involved in cell wall biosynthesis